MSKVLSPVAMRRHNRNHILAVANGIYPVFKGVNVDLERIAATILDTLKVHGYFLRHINTENANRLAILRRQRKGAKPRQFRKALYDDNGKLIALECRYHGKMHPVGKFYPAKGAKYGYFNICRDAERRRRGQKKRVFRKAM